MLAAAGGHVEQFRLGAGPRVSLGLELKSAGEGRITEVAGHPEWVAKIFHTTFTGVANDRDLHEKRERLNRKREKVPVLVANRPPGWRDASGHVVLAWPSEVLLEGRTVVGFVMPKVDLSDAVELHQVSNTSDRADPMPLGPQWVRNVNFRHLVYIARNLSAAVGAAHLTGAVIGDFNERNVLVAPTTQVSLVDCDSMQIRKGSTIYPCELARPEYTAPELQRTKTPVMTPESDFFALAVHIYSLLMDGAHPFQGGTWSGAGERPGAVERIKLGYYSGGPNSPVSPMPSALPMSFLPPFVLDLFERAFAGGMRTPSRRPSTLEWGDALTRLLKTL